MKKFIFLSIVFVLIVCSASVFAQNRKSVSAAEVNGTFKMNGNEFKILALGKGQLKVAFFGTYEYKMSNGQPMANTGEAAGTATIEGDTATFVPLETDACTIKMVFLRGGKLKVTQEGDSAVCGFGNNVNATGTYKKTGNAKPKF
jgi:hypothetical protein